MIKHNLYFNEQVQSLGFTLDGDDKTVGVINTGSYHFGTQAAERMSIIAGAAEVQLDEQTEVRTVKAGESFEVPANSGFTISVAAGSAAYLCEFLPE